VVVLYATALVISSSNSNGRLSARYELRAGLRLGSETCTGVHTSIVRRPTSHAKFSLLPALAASLQRLDFTEIERSAALTYRTPVA
jgi:hypothetical protein